VRPRAIFGSSRRRISTASSDLQPTAGRRPRSAATRKAARRPISVGLPP